MRPTIIFLFLFITLFKASADAPAPSFPAEFVQNNGQWASPILFNTQLPQGWLFLEKSGFTYNFLDQNYFNTETTEDTNNKRLFKGHAFRVKFVNANPGVKISGNKTLLVKRNYFIGKESNKWATNVPAYAEVIYKKIFPGVDMQVYSNQNQLKYDYLVEPRANISDIKVKYEGAKDLFLRNGRLIIKTSVNEIAEEKPFAYQVVAGQRQEVACEFTLNQAVVGFKIGNNYNPDLPLVIDPEILFMTYSGSNAGLSANCATADASGNTYIASRTMGPAYPVTNGAYQTVRQGNNTGISKFNPDGTALLYATYLGGSTFSSNNDEYPLALTVNRQNELIILGHTTASDFPTTSSAYDRTYNENRDYFISKLSPTGSTLTASTYLGGSAQESGVIGNTPAQLALDDAGNIFVAGCTFSGNFPIVNGFQSIKKGNYDGIVVKLNNSLSSVLWSSFIGGNSEELLYDIKIGASGKIYLGGSTNSWDFPNTAGTVNPQFIGIRDGFIAIISATGNALETATFVGTSQTDLVKYIQVDKDENVYATGYTTGSYPITPADTYGTPNSTGGYFIHKFNSTLRNTIFSTHLGSHSGINKVPTAFRVNNCQEIYLAGFALNTSPLSADAKERNHKTMYVCHLSKDAKQLVYGSYLGGTEGQPHTHLANTSLITEAGTLYQIECTYSSNQPVTPGAYDPTYFNSPDAAVIKFQFTPYLADQVRAKANTPPPSCAPYSVQFANTTENGVTYTWNFGDNSNPSTQINPTHTYRTPGSYRVRLIAANPNSCKLQDTTFINVTVAPPPAKQLPRLAQYLCNQSVLLDAKNDGYNFLWSTGETSQTISVSEPGTYKVELSIGDCKFTDSVEVAAALPPLEVPNIFTPNKDGKNDYFEIKNSGDNTKLQIFNRWGNLVYQNDNYANDWDGRNLSQGTYYYLVQSASNCTTKKGWFEIIY